MACTGARFGFDIFVKRPVHSAVQLSRVTKYKRIAPVDQSDLGIVITSDAGTYVELDIHPSIRRKLMANDGSSLDTAANTTVINNLLIHFSQCSVTLKGISVSSSKDRYN
jgi:hypothetical protein